MPDTYQFSNQFQLKILALMARDKETFITYKDVIKPSYFKSAIHIDLARILHDYYDTEMQRVKSNKGTVVTAPTAEVLYEEIRKLTNNNQNKKKLSPQYVETTLDILDVDLSDKEYIKDSIVSFGRQAALEHAILESADIIEKGNVDFTRIEELVTTAVRVGDDISDMGTDYFATAEDRINTYLAGSDGVKRVPSGLEDLDKIMKGGLGGGELGIVIAPPNRGKSYALCNIGAGGVMAGEPVVHFTLEMPEKQVAKRYDLRLNGKTFEGLKLNAAAVVRHLSNLSRNVRGKLFIKKYRTNDCTVDTLRSFLTKLYVDKGIKPGVIIVDYADLLQPKKSYKDKRFELESIYLELRDLADEYDCPVWTASQTNRGGLDKKVITMADLAEAFNKANIADFMVSLCQTTEEKESNLIRWYVAKQRDGEANITISGEIDYVTATMICKGITKGEAG